MFAPFITYQVEKKLTITYKEIHLFSIILKIIFMLICIQVIF